MLICITERLLTMSEQSENLRRERIVDYLAERALSIADVYRGGIKVLEQDYPEQLPQSAHSLREVIYMLTKLDEIKKFGRMKRIQPIITRKEDLVKNLDPLSGIPNAYVLHDKLVGDVLNWFSSVAHHGKYPTKKEFMKKVVELEILLEQILKPHFEVTDEIDKLLKIEIPKQKDFDDLKFLLSRNASAYNYFFQNASVNWLPILLKEKYLKDPQHIADVGSQRKPVSWPPAIFLWKLASLKPSEVSQIICSFKTPKKNNERSPWILDHFVKAALEMPPEYCKCIAETIFREKWLETAYTYYPLVISVSKLMTKFADAGFKIETVCLASALLRIKLSEPRDADLLEKEKKRYVKPIVEDYWFTKLVKEEIHHAFEKFPKPITSFCVKHVTDMIWLENLGNGNKESKVDKSVLWRRAIENHEQNHRGDFRSQLVGKLGDFLIALGHKSITSLKQVLNEMSKVDYPVFRRLELYVYWSFPEHFKRQINRAINVNFDKYELHHEYFHLLANCLPYATKKTREKYLACVDIGPDERRIKSWMARKENQEPGTVDLMIGYWKANKIAPIKKHLTEEEAKKFADLMDDNSIYPDFHIYSHGAKVSEPKSELKDNLTPDEVFKFISSYAIKKQLSFGYYDGTPQKFQEYVAKEPQNYSRLALRCLGLDSEFKHRFFRGAEDAIKQKNTIDWESVFSLCTRIIDLAKDQKDHKICSTIDHIVSLLKAGMELDSINFDFRNRVWKLLTSLITLQNSDRVRGDEHVVEDWDVFGLTSDTTDEQTFYSVIAYIIWCEQHTKKRFFDPGAKKLITDYLEQKITATISRQVVLGYQLVNLYYYDSGWIRKRLTNLFKNQDDKFSKAAWHGYLTGVIHGEVFRDLIPQYETHVKKLGSAMLDNGELLGDDKQVIEHITKCCLYQIEEAENIFTRMIQNTHEKVHSHCAWIITMVLREHKQRPIRSFNIEAFRKVWEDSQLTSNPELLFWVEYSPFDKKKTLELFYNSLVKSPKSITFPLSFEELEPYTETYPQLTLSCLDLLIRTRSRDPDFYIFGEKLKNMLRILLKKDETRSSATALIHYLGEHGIYEYKDLL